MRNEIYDTKGNLLEVVDTPDLTNEQLVSQQRIMSLWVYENYTYDKRSDLFDGKNFEQLKTIYNAI